MIYDINGIKIIIHKDVCCDLEKYYTENTKEVGGILLGRFVNKKTYEITEIVCVCCQNSTNTRYQRDVKTAQRIINKRWCETKGEINYLGEWHTHPGMSATPSFTDMKSICEIAEIVKCVLPVVILMIMGTDRKLSLSIKKENENYACIFNK